MFASRQEHRREGSEKPRQLGIPTQPTRGGSGREAEYSWVIRQRPWRKVSKQRQRGHISKLRRALESRCVTALGKRQEEARKAT